MDDKQREKEADERPEEERESTSSAKDKLPGAPAKDDPTPLGDTDQHSDA